MQWWLACLKNYADFDGRARRTEYWMYSLFQFVIFVVLFALWFAPKIGLLFLVLSFLYGIATVIPGLAVGVRRLHDQDKSGLWLLIAFVPFVGGIWLLVLTCLPGTVGPNQYGPDPKDPNALAWQQNQYAQMPGTYPPPGYQQAPPAYPPQASPYPPQASPYPPQASPYPPQQGYPPQQAYPQQQGQPPYPGQ